jgi:hypothetical protein
MTPRIAGRSPIVVALVCLLAVPAGAAEIPRGTLELALAGGFERSEIEDSSFTTVEFGTRLSKSLSNRFATGMTIGYAHDTTDAGFDRTSLGLNLDLIANFPSGSRVIPYGQLSVGLTTYSGTFYDQTEVGYTFPFIGVGIRSLVGDHASVNLLAGYRHQIRALGLDDTNANDILVTFGISVFPNGIQ